MSFISTIGKAISNPYVREILHGLAGSVKGQSGADLVSRAFKLFDQLKSAFEAFKNPTTSKPSTKPSALPKPPSSIGSSSSASTSSAGQSSGITQGGSVRTSGITIGKDAFNTGLTADQNDLLANVKDPTQKAQMEAQFKMQNYQNLMSFISNIMKIMGDISRSIIQNIRS